MPAAPADEIAALRQALEAAAEEAESGSGSGSSGSTGTTAD